MDLGVSLEVGAVKPKSEEGRVSNNNPASKNENWKFRGLDCAIKLTPQLFAFCCPRVNGVFFDSSWFYRFIKRPYYLVCIEYKI